MTIEKPQKFYPSKFSTLTVSIYLHADLYRIFAAINIYPRVSLDTKFQVEHAVTLVQKIAIAIDKPEKRSVLQTAVQSLCY